MTNKIKEKYYRFEVGDVGIYEAVDKDCPKDDERRKSKPDGSWLAKAGPSYPKSISYWTLEGLIKYFASGLLDWHVSVVKGDVTVKIIEKSKSVNYFDDDQIILEPENAIVIEEISFSEFENRLRIREDLIHKFNESVTKLYKTLGEPNIDPNNPGKFFKKFSNEDGIANMNLLLRNIPTSHRLFYLKDRFVDACFNVQVLKGDLKIKAEKVPDDFLKSGTVFAMIDNTYVAVKSLLNFLAYFFNTEYLDEDLSELEFINAIDLEDQNIKSFANQIIKSPQWKLTKEYKESKDNGCLGMTRLIPKEDTKDNIKLDMQKRNFQNMGLVTNNISTLLIRLSFTFDMLAEYISEKYSNTKGYTRGNDIMAATDDKSGNLKRTRTPEKTKKLFKIYNFQLDKPQEIFISRYRLKRSPEYDALKSLFYRGIKNVSQTISYKQHRPVEVSETVIPKNEGDMLWTHTLEVDDYKYEEKDQFEEVVELCTLLLSLFSGKAVYTEESKFRHSHKAYTAGRIEKINIEEAVNHALKTIDEQSDENHKYFLISQLFEYRGMMQNTSYDKQLVDLWSLVDKFAEFCIGDKKYELDNNTRKKLEETAAEIAPDDDQEQCRLVDAMTREYSLFRRIREYIFDNLKIQDKASIDRKEFKKILGKVYKYRSELTHESKYSVDKEKLTGLVDYYLFLSNLVLIIFLEELDVKVEYSKNLLLQELKGFVGNPEAYYEEKTKRVDESYKNIQDAMDYLSGKKPLPPGKTTLTF